MSAEIYYFTGIGNHLVVARDNLRYMESKRNNLLRCRLILPCHHPDAKIVDIIKKRLICMEVIK